MPPTSTAALLSIIGIGRPRASMTLIVAYVSRFTSMPRSGRRTFCRARLSLDASAKTSSKGLVVTERKTATGEAYQEGEEATMSQELPAEHRRPWSDTDKDKLTFWWGTFKLPTLATRLNRTQWAVAQMARQLKLGPFSRGEGISMREFERISGYSSSKIEAAAKALDIKLKRVERSDPIRRRPLARFVITDDQQDALLQHMLAHENYYMNLPGSGKTTRGVWGIGKKPSACQRCGRNDRPHFSNGYCKPCQVFVHKRNKRMNDTSPIMRFTGHYRFLSNFFPATIVYEDEKYYSLEHAYQAGYCTCSSVPA
jgi:hypothetical protein